MKILSEKLSRSALKSSNFAMGGEMVKAVVDIDRNLLAIDAELHADLEKLLLENGSDQFSLWGINLYFDGDLIEFDSMINIRPAQGNRSRDVENEATRTAIVNVVNNWITDD
ncbi:hypothetical protein IKD57_00920 [Candidatus Saccharibacteria bacterium]|nr:hypothetical protein [Candidatus Saccharibacteria bacterium]